MIADSSFIERRFINSLCHQVAGSLMMMMNCKQLSKEVLELLYERWQTSERSIEIDPPVHMKPIFIKFGIEVN